MKEKSGLIFDSKENFLWSLEEEVGNKVGVIMCRRASDNKLVDVTEGGKKYCATWVSKFLLGQSNKSVCFISEPHATVEATEKDLLESGWEIRENRGDIIVLSMLRPGDILVWESKKIFGNKNKHIGFFKSHSTRTAVSTSAELFCVVEHHYTYGDTRQILRVYFHPIIL